MKKTIKLILGKVPNDYSPVSHILISPHCFSGNDSYAYKYYQYIEDDAFINPVEISNSEVRCNEIALILFDQLYPKLNKLNNINMGKQFWRTVLFPWLLYTVQMIFERKTRISKLIKKYSGYEIYVDLVNSDIDWIFEDNYDFMDNGIHDIDFNKWLFSIIIEKMNPPMWNIKYLDQPVFVKSQNRGNHNFKILKHKLKQIIHYLYPPRVKNIYGFKYIDYLVFSLILSFAGKGRSKSNASTNEIELSYSETGSGISEIQFYDQIVWKVIPTSIKNIAKRLKKGQLRVREGRLNLVSAMEITNNDNSKLEYALRCELGEKLVLIQHGGHNYGTSKINSIPNFVEYNNHMFLTWGWQRQEDYSGNFVPLESPFLSQFIGQYKKITDEIIFVGNRMTYFWESFDGTPQPKQSLQYREDKKNFISYLDEPIVKHLVYRPYFKKSKTIGDREYFEKYLPEINIYDSIRNNEFSFHKRLLKCSLLVLDHPGTTFIIAIVANIPMVCFWNKNIFPFSKQSDWILNELGDVGVYFDNPKAAALRINKVYKNVQSWWSQEIIQDVRKKIIKEQALNNKNWRSKWLRFFWENFIRE